MKPQILFVVVALIAVFAPPARAQETTPAVRTDAPPRRLLYVHAFRAPSQGLEYRSGSLGVHAGYYRTILGQADSDVRRETHFWKVGVTHYVGLGRRRMEGFGSLAYVRGVSQDWRGRDGVFFDAGVRYALTDRFEARLGAGVLVASGRPARLNPTVGISYAIPLR